MLDEELVVVKLEEVAGADVESNDEVAGTDEEVTVREVLRESNGVRASVVDSLVEFVLDVMVI